MASRPGSITRRHPVALLIPLLLLLAACGDDDESSATVCDARADLESSLAALGEIDVPAEGTDAVEAAVDDVGDDVEAVADAAQEEVDDEVDDVQAAVDELEAAVTSFGEQETTGAAVAAVSRAVTDLAVATGALTEALSQECDTGG
ncbi:MAG TPA: hypothetical protein VFZ79_13680 [Acidimicrobiales bacterium]